MRKPFRLREYNDPSRPTLNFIVTFRENGRRKRKFFTTKRDAENFTRNRTLAFQAQGREGAEFPSWLRVMADECNVRLEPHGKTLKDATDHFIAFLDASAKSGTVAEIVAELLKAKETDGASPRHLRDLRDRLTRFGQSFGEQNAATVSTAQIDDWLRALELSPQSRNNYRTVINNLFNFAVSRGYAVANPVERTAKAKVKRGAPEILTCTQAVALLNACDADTLPFVAISLFAGLRAAEAERLDWSEVDLDGGHIEVKGAKAKTGSRRLIPISENLAAWIRPLARRAGAVAPVALRDRLDAAKARAGFKTWPANAMRHSYASYRLADCHDAARVSLEMGNSPQIIFAHYRELVKPKDAARYWQIGPSTEARKVIHLGRAAA
jgi:integrase